METKKRGRTELKAIENPISMRVAFSKRRSGLFKKAQELSVLCQADIALIVFSSRGKLFQFSSSSMQGILERYGKEVDVGVEPRMEQNAQTNETERQLMRKIEELESSKRKMFGEDLESSGIRELQQLERRVERSLRRIRTKQMKQYRQKIKQLLEKEKRLAAEIRKYVSMLKQCGAIPGDHHQQQGPKEKIKTKPCSGNEGINSDVETELFIGPPGRRSGRGRTLRN